VITLIGLIQLNGNVEEEMLDAVVASAAEREKEFGSEAVLLAEVVCNAARYD
jgi:hypothetical protein